ncbi:hypothetical protein HK57_00574 [Aspergillus ustus]|uniref:Rhodopsin domain-containing protein n=1 Tax=Aspergillus ustus TaxID=40382 RepID=A0A0C1E285_ASPUT|nr:hypothetical protein HK57_00574 [Aspergillus ustus]
MSNEDALISSKDAAPPMVRTLRGVVITGASLATIICCARLYVRAVVVKSFGIDDIMVIFALLLVLMFAAVSVALSYYGIGRHSDDVPQQDLIDMQYVAYISYCLYLWVGAVVKSSIAVFIMRVFPTPTIRKFGLGLIIFLVIFAISGELPLILQCSPVRAAYDVNVQGDCLSPDTLFAVQVYQGVVMIIVDIYLFILPIPTTWKLQMSKQRRLSIIGLFSIGLLACIAGIARLPSLVYTNGGDFTYQGAVASIWMNVEFALALIAGSLPSLRVILKFIPGMVSENSHGITTTETNGRRSTGRGGEDSSSGAIHLGATRSWTSKMLGKKNAEITTLHSMETDSREQIVYPGRLD